MPVKRPAENTQPPAPTTQNQEPSAKDALLGYFRAALTGTALSTSLPEVVAVNAMRIATEAYRLEREVFEAAKKG